MRVLEKTLLKRQEETIENFKVSDPELANMEYLDSTHFMYGIGNPNNLGSKVLHRTTQKIVKRRNSENGMNHILIGNYLLVAIYQYWEDIFRGDIAKMFKIKKNDLSYDIFGDIKSIRRSIIHHNGIALKAVNDNRILTWFKKDDRIYINDKKFQIIISEIQKAINKMKKELTKLSLISQ